MLGEAAPSRAEHSDRVCLVDHEPRLVASLDGEDLRQIRDVTVGAVYALDDDQCPAVPRANLVEQPVQGSGIVVGKGEAVRA